VSHLHVVDGVLPWWVVAVSFALSALLLALLLPRRDDAARVLLLSRVGVAAAALVVVMSLPLGPGIHLSLAPLAGMMLGPGGGFLAAFLANGCLSVFGHGGLTAAGVNGLFLGAQAVLGAVLFAGLRRPFGARAGAVAATFLTLALAAAAAIAALRELPLEAGEHGHDHDHEGEWGVWIVGGLALVAALVETWITASVIAFLARVRTDLVRGGGAPA
jgi:cobalt/nickel transport system permease protein